MTSRVRQKVETFVTVLKDITQLSTASKLKVGAISLHWQFQKIASFGYNGSYPGAVTFLETGTEEESIRSSIFPCKIPNSLNINRCLVSRYSFTQ